MAYNTFQVGSIPNYQGGNQLQGGGPSGDSWVSELHGKWYSAARLGRVFLSASLIAGVTIPVNTATAATFLIANPVGSQVNLELISLGIGWPAADAPVVGTILGTVSAQTPTSVTAIANPILQMPLNGGGGWARVGQVYTAATVVASTAHIPLINLGLVTVPGGQVYTDFDGKIILGPGEIMQLTSTPVQTAAAMPCLIWAEYNV
jgi:hypothetical protein